MDALATSTYDLLILDLMLPDMDGVEVCRRVRQWSGLPVVVLSAYGEEEIKVRALDEGADDFVTKPFSAPELLARMRSALRRVSAVTPSEPVVQVEDVQIDLSRRRVTRSACDVHLDARPSMRFCECWSRSRGG